MNKYILIFTAFLFFSCGSDNKEVKSITSQSDTVEKDTQTKPEEGGYGFEQIAEDMGYTTYEWNESVDKTFFGDPKASKGEH